MDRYVTGGSLQADDPTYIVRDADEDLFSHCFAGDFCYVLTPRQMGKSSLMVRVARRLQQVSEPRFRTAIVDLTEIGQKDITAEQWYYAFVDAVVDELDIGAGLEAWWEANLTLPPLRRLTKFLGDVLLAECRDKIVIFVDEIDTTIGLPFSDDFFAALRACHNKRATDSEFKRLSFVLLGVATPSQLISDTKRTPFNLGHRIDLDDFTNEQAAPLAEGLNPDAARAQALLSRVLHWSGGHPYLTQKLCEETRTAESSSSPTEKFIDDLVDGLLLSPGALRSEDNLTFVRNRLADSDHKRAVLKTYRRIREGQTVVDEPQSPVHATLKLSGVVKVGPSGEFSVRNHVYEQVFSPAWVDSEMPENFTRRVAFFSGIAAVLAVTVGITNYLFQTEQTAAIARLNEVATVQDLGGTYRVEFTEPIEDIEPYMAELEQIDVVELLLRSTKIISIDPLSSLENLQHLDLFNTEVTDLTPVAKLQNLQYLEISYTPVNDFTPLRTAQDLQTLWLQGTKITDLTPLSNLRKLESLFLAYTQVIDLTPLAGLTALEDLYLHGAPVEDLTPLHQLPNLGYVNLSGVPASDEQFRALRKALPNLKIDLEE